MSISNILQPNNYDIYVNNINDTSNRVDELWVDNINGSPYPPGAGPIPVLVRNKFLRTTDVVSPSMFWGDVNVAELVHGTANQVLVTNQLGTQSQWSSSLSLPSNLVVGGSSTLESNVVCEQTLTVNGNVQCDAALTCNASFDCGLNANFQSDITCQGNLQVDTQLDVNGDLWFNGNGGSTNQVIVKTGVGTQDWQNLQPDMMGAGSLNQVLITGFDGLNLVPTWSDDVDIPGLLNVTNATTLQSTLQVASTSSLTGATTCIGKLTTTNGTDLQGTTNIIDDLQCNSNSGFTGQYLVKSSATTQNWLTPPNIKLVRYVTYFAAQDLNAGAGPAPVIFDDVNTISNLASGSTAVVTGIAMPNTTQFTIGQTGTYDIDITGFVDGAGIGNSVICIVAEIAGFEITRNTITNNSGNSFTGKIPSVVISSGQNLRILTKRLAGTSALNTNAPFSLPNNYPSTISISLVNIV